MSNDEILLKALQKENQLIIEKYKKIEEKFNEEKEINKKILEEKNAIREQLDSILYSRTYKIMSKINKILGR